MWRRFAFVLLSAAAASCGQKSSLPPGAKEVPSFPVTSAFRTGQTVPVQFTCEGANQSLPVQWSGAPAGTKSYAVILDDPDAPNHVFTHWGVYDIPAGVNAIAAGAVAKGPVFTQAVNHAAKAGYFGPCPPHGGAPHKYHLKVYALDVERLNLAPTTTVADMESVAKTHGIGLGEIVGDFGRK